LAGTSRRSQLPDTDWSGWFGWPASIVHETVLPIAALAWAASAKDPGLTPALILNELMRTGRYQQSELDELAVTGGVSAPELNTKLRRAIEEARAAIAQLPPNDVGCLYLDRAGCAVMPDLERLGEHARHFGRRGGHWPSSSAILSEMIRDPEPPSSSRA
jgi:hypothetical protein